MSKIELENATFYIIDKKKKNAYVILHELSCAFADNAINVILGASGSGKTTLLKIIAGIEKLNQGTLYFDDEDVTNVSPQKRNVAYLSQNYALYPHLTVFENIAYPLLVQKIDEEEIRYRVREVLELLSIDIIKNRKPRELSGGQMQRVAMARAIVKRPDILLLDEPFSNVDETFRTSSLTELIELQEKLQLTILYVTHSLKEASILNEHIYIMNQGKIVEKGNINSLIKDENSFFYNNFIKE